jgi:NADH-quinone oxidoreductase subunit L
MFIYAWLIFISPLVGFVLSYLVGIKYRNWSGIIASTSIGLSLLFSYLTYLQVNASGPIHESVHWFYSINYGIYVDHLSLVMVLMVSFVGLMIHLYAMHYMGKDPNRHVYFAETALFTAGMLGLVISSNLVFFFLFWELVGLCSYLLIGFWFFKPNAASAAKKAFIVTRVGDLLFLAGMALLYTHLIGFTGLNGSSPLSIPYLINNAGLVAAHVGKVTLGIVSVLFLAAAAGKSSQFPLHVWIPDAMEGPTTVSALIHAATMVTAGIYLVARLFQIFQASAPFALESVAILGAFTAVFAGILGLVVNDLKRILAYSTISQLGYMLAAIGLGGFLTIGYSGVAYGMYHLVVHAMFKALLFMTAGSLLLAMMELRDVRRMGGLWKRMPVTVTLMFIGAITLAAIPPTAAYFSKDAIIDAAWTYFTGSGYGFISFLPWLFLVTGALLTVLYTFRMFFLVALGKPRSKLAEEAKDPPLHVQIPLFFLAAFSLGFGIWQSHFYDYISPSTPIPSAPIYIEAIPWAFIVIGVVITYYLYGTERWKHFHFSGNPLYKVVKNKFYIDYLFTNIIAERVILPLSAAFSTFESHYNTSVDVVGHDTMRLGTFMRRIQDGIIRNYFVVLISGISIIFIIMEILRLI